MRFFDTATGPCRALACTALLLVLTGWTSACGDADPGTGVDSPSEVAATDSLDSLSAVPDQDSGHSGTPHPSSGDGPDASDSGESVGGDGDADGSDSDGEGSNGDGDADGSDSDGEGSNGDGDADGSDSDGEGSNGDGDADVDGGMDDTDSDGGGDGSCRTNSDCAEEEYCHHGAGNVCGQDEDTPGSCTLRPEGCGGVVQPVCGCDDETWSSGCIAASAGMNVAHDGPCNPVGCGLPPAENCCFSDEDCSLETRCVGAVCSPNGEEEAGTCVTRNIDEGECWTDSDCDSATRCHEPNRCPCAHACFLPDEPGTCEPFIGPPVDPVE